MELFKMKINYDCRHFRGDIPCRPHKEKGVHCEGCHYYDPIKERILIIKLDSPGDVLRTTAILPGLKEKYPHAQITWLTRAEAIPFFEGNIYVDRVFDIAQAALVLETDEYDTVINLDAAPLSSRLASAAAGKEKIGFVYDPRGFVYPANPESEEWFLMGVFDDVKKANQKTYQSIMLKICGLRPSDYSIQYFLKPEDMAFANMFAGQNGLNNDDMVIGLNTGAGGRWEKKKWTEEGFIEFIKILRRKYPQIKMLLYGGPGEVSRNKRIAAGTGGGVIDTGCNSSIRHFAALLNLCSLLVTGDTMALHLALALKKKVVALVGPTSAAELELYERGIKITADLSCLCCYAAKCDKDINCMNSIHPLRVMDAVEILL